MSVPVVIGGADGPTSVFLAGRLGGGWINVFGLCIVIAILVPNIIYAFRFRGVENKCTNKVMNIIEQIGRYGCMLFLCCRLAKAGLLLAVLAHFCAISSVMRYFYLHIGWFGFFTLSDKADGKV